MMTTLETLKLMLKSDYDLDPDQIASDSTLTSLGLDSLALAELLFGVEDRFHISLTSELPQLDTIGEVADYIDSIIKAQVKTSPASDAQGNHRDQTALNDT
jgi:acyl carrier protein